MKKVDSLYTPKEVKEARKRLFEKAKGVDPILREKINFDDSVMDHDHTSQHCRSAIHRQSNAFEGLVFNAYKRCLQWLTDKPLPVILRNLADYIETDFRDNPYHPGWVKRVTTDFSKLSSKQQDEVLLLIGTSVGKNAAERKKLFNKRLLDKVHGYDIIRNIINEVKDGYESQD
jgi:hypothetical protein